MKGFAVLSARGIDSAPMADVNARERVRQRLRVFLAERGITQRAFAKRLGHKDQWGSKLVNGKFGLSLEDLDDAARILEVTPSQLVHNSTDELWELRPTEMRMIRALRALPPTLRDHLVILAEYLMGVAPDELEFLKRFRELTAEEKARVQYSVDVLRVTQSVQPKTETPANQPEAKPRGARKGRAPSRKAKG